MFTPIRQVGAALALGLILVTPTAAAQTLTLMNPNSVQPETTLSISATATAERTPDIAILTGGVTTEASTAEDAIAENATRMTGLFDALKEAGIAEKDIQTSQFSLQPNYNYPKDAPRELTGYTASNRVTVRVEDLDGLGSTIDAMVAQGGNAFDGLQFSLKDPREARNEARREAMAAAMERAELYAEAAGYRVSRIVTINEQMDYRGPQPMAEMSMRSVSAADQAPTPIAAGEIGYSATVNVVYELMK